MDEGQYAMVLAQIALLNCEIAGMQAENAQRMSCGHSIAFAYDAFEEVRRKYEPVIGFNAIAALAAGRGE